jgi:hypothetical protein
MEEYLRRVWEQLIGRVHGPLTLRLLLQPTVVAILAILDAMKDARDGRPPFGWALVTDSAKAARTVAGRLETGRQGLRCGRNHRPDL